MQGASGMGALGAFFHPVWPSDVDDYVRKLDVDFQTTDRAVKSCASLPTSTAQAWASFLASWSKFRDEGTGWFGAGGRWDATEDYQKRLSDWQELVAGARCDVGGPLVQAPATDNAITWIAIAVAAGAVVYMFGPAIRSLATRAVAKK
jgi:hypothetical protein